MATPMYFPLLKNYGEVHPEAREELILSELSDNPGLQEGLKYEKQYTVRTG